jgi:hypothetical protein
VDYPNVLVVVDAAIGRKVDVHRRERTIYDVRTRDRE